VVVCLVALAPPAGPLLGAGLGPPAALMVRRAAGRPRPGPPDPTLPLVLDLVAAGLRAGRPVPDCLELAASAAGFRTAGALTEVSALLRLGAEPVDAWQAVAGEPALAPVAAAARRSATSGIRLAAGFEATANDLRAASRAAALARAQRAGVWAAAPLGVCFLPAFVCLGVAPVVIGVLREVFR
jgi:Flp pilus assembly protein TadB